MFSLFPNFMSSASIFKGIEGIFLEPCYYILRSPKQNMQNFFGTTID